MTLGHAGSSGNASVLFNVPVTLNATPAAGDNSLRVADTAYVAALGDHPTTVNGLTLTANPPDFRLPAGLQAKPYTINNTITLAGIDGTTMTFPSVSAAIAALGVAQTFSAANIFTANGAASTPGLTVSGAPYTGGTATTNFPQFYINSGAAVSTFSTAGTMFGVNAPSGFTGHLLNFFVNGNSTRFRVDYAGDLFASGTGTFSSTVTAPALLPGTLYSAAGTPLPTCASGIKGQMAVVSDATSPTYMGAYASGGGHHRRSHLQLERHNLFVANPLNHASRRSHEIQVCLCGRAWPLSVGMPAGGGSCANSVPAGYIDQ